jgi:hypothetical protein
MKRLVVLSILLVGSVSHASADIIATTPNFQVFSAATADYTFGPYDDPAPPPTRIWVEQLALSLLAPVVLDTDLADTTKQYVINGPVAGQVAFGPAGGPTLAVGSRVNVYYAYFDPADLESGRGTVTFDAPVLGIVAYTERLASSDFLKVGGAPYIGTFAERGWENTEWGQLSSDRRTLTFFGTASDPGDQFRIFTAVPEPGSLMLMGLGALAMARRRRAMPRLEC